MTSSRRSLRANWAARVLFLLGLFGFAVGWANACIHHQPLQLGGGYERAVQAPASAQHAHHAPADTDVPDCDAASNDGAGLCDSPQRATATSDAPRLLDGAAWPPAIHAVAAAWAVARIAPQGRPQARTSPPGISVVLRFLRLTL